MTTEPNPPKVFISYSHDSQEHVARVLRLSDALCNWGIDCHIDQYELAPANWLSWMERQIREADSVLIVCTEIYCRRFEGRETRPSGVGWEGGIITTQLYEQQQDKAA
ncbi:MAG: SEFIR domain-containing protein, partial [Blastocatellia bacterium]